MFPFRQTGLTTTHTQGTLMYLQLHYEVQVVGALVDVLQSHNILVLYPGEERRGNSLKSLSIIHFSARHQLGATGGLLS